MSAVSSDLIRWVNISIIKYFTDIAIANSITMFVEGIDERSEHTMRTNHAELRIQGPLVRLLSRNVWRVRCDVNILFTYRMQMASENAYTLKNWGGIFMAAMESPINVYKYGDDESLLGCLRVKLDRNTQINFFDFGEMGTDTRVRQAELDASFEMITGE